MNKSVDISVDSSANACYVQLSDEAIVTTVPINDDATILVDLDQFNVAVGIEILDLAEPIPLTQLCTKFHILPEHASVLNTLLPSVAQTISVFQLSYAADSSASLQKGTHLDRENA